MKIYKQKASGYCEEVDEGFNWFAFLFGPLWYLFKGMIGLAILVFLGLFLLSLILGWFGAIIGWVIMGTTGNKSYEDHLISRGYSVIKNKTPWKCLYCKKEFGNKEKLDSHEERCKNNKMAWKCDKCGKEFETKKEAEKHEKNCKG